MSESDFSAMFAKAREAHGVLREHQGVFGPNATLNDGSTMETTPLGVNYRLADGHAWRATPFGGNAHFPDGSSEQDGPFGRSKFAADGSSASPAPPRRPSFGAGGFSSAFNQAGQTVGTQVTADRIERIDMDGDETRMVVGKGAAATVNGRAFQAPPGVELSVVGDRVYFDGVLQD